MSYHGKIKLFSQNETPIVEKYYWSRESRDEIIANWADVFTERFPNAIIHICPSVDTSKVKANGENMGIKKEEDQPKKNIRPPAIYTNLPVYNYKEDTPKNTTNE